MSNATVTIKVTTTEFDLIRTSLEFSKNTCIAEMKDDAKNDAATRAANRERAGQYTDLLRKLA